MFTISRMRLGLHLALLVAALPIPLAGCTRNDRPALASVHGKVTLQGRPLPGASIVFQPDDGKSSHAVTDEQGRYELVYLPGANGAVIGRHRVTITTATEEAPDERLPARYHRESELIREVTSGDNPIDFDLQPSR